MPPKNVDATYFIFYNKTILKIIRVCRNGVNNTVKEKW